MGNLEELIDSDPSTEYTPHGGTHGSVSTLPMTEEEKKIAVPRPIGFIWMWEGQEQ